MFCFVFKRVARACCQVGAGEVRLVVWNQIPGMSESQWLPSYIDDRGTFVALVHCIDARYVAALLY